MIRERTQERERMKIREKDYNKKGNIREKYLKKRKLKDRILDKRQRDSTCGDDDEE